MSPVCRSQCSGKVSRIGHRGPNSLSKQIGIYGAV
nr:MAG TPA: Potassium channel toxin kappa-KTX3.1/ALPHA MOTIF, ALPHA SCORPION TOXIN [Caudoviricetes sp.]